MRGYYYIRWRSNHITARGVCWSTVQNPTVADDTTNDGTGAGSFTSNITGLTSSTTYYVRAYATKSAGTGYGSVMFFKTTVTDIDDNTYQTVKIGDQTWMAENLKVTHYRNGDPIPNVTDDTEWANITNGAYCAYDNDESNADVYGYLYNWFAVEDSRNIAPEGWHVPTNNEWETLVDYLGGYDVAGGKLKETGTTHWDSPNTGATNQVNFTGLPNGNRFYGDGKFHGLGGSGTFWSSTGYNSGNAWSWMLIDNLSGIYNNSPAKNHGKSVRLVRSIKD